MKKYIHKIKKFYHKHYHRTLRQKHSPHQIALGFAIGTFIGIIPTGGLGIFLGLLVIYFYKELSKIAVFAGMAIWNPFTMVPVYYASYKIGDIIFDTRTNIDINPNETFLRHAFNFSERYLLGNLILAIMITSISYFFMRKAVIAYRNRKEKKSLKNKN